MKAVLFSIKPKYCELIASSKKTVEVRKTRPKIDVPFKGYIYCTKDFYRAGDGYFQGKYCGKVIGEFVCKAILPISITYSDQNSKIALREFPFTCLTDKEIMDYLGNGKTGYGFHISDLVIYNKPKELGEFYTDSCINFREGGCVSPTNNCVYQFHNSQGDIQPCITKLKRPPQSYCYVEELV